MSVNEVPELVPARMVNEFTYCPRLFFLEWVQSRFADNTDTVEGRYVHRRPDRGGGRAPLPPDGDVRAARSLDLSSPELGLTAKLDVLEGGDGEVWPVERKHGAPPDNPERSWEPERVQLCVQGLLLREAGYRCDAGYLSFADTNERVRIEFDDLLVDRTLELLGELREVARRDEAPRPLLDSPKCPRCSLVGLCLPDETNALAGRAALPLRRLLPRDPAARPLYVSEQGAYLGRDGGRLEVKKKGELLRSVRLLDVSQVSVFGNVQVSTQVLRELFTREVPVCFFSYGGWFSGLAHGMPSKHVELRRRQVVVAAQGGLAVAARCVEGKIKNSRVLLRRTHGTGRPARSSSWPQELTPHGGPTASRHSLGWKGRPHGPTSTPSPSCSGKSTGCRARPSPGTAVRGARLSTPSTVFSPTCTRCS